MKSSCHGVSVRRVVTADPDESVVCAAQRMRDEHIGDLIIVDQGRPAGIVTDRDLVVRVLAAEREPDSLSVREVMTRALATVSEDSDVFDVLELMHRTGARRMPVVDEDGALTGILALDDIVAWLARQMAVVSGLIGQEVRAERERLGFERAGPSAG
jgi:CBS domain-containing protein